MGSTKADIPHGGGGWVNENQHAHEACNFLPCDDGNVYGHFETIKGENDREVRLERLGANPTDNCISNVDVVWTAPFNGNAGRHVVGWYKNATVYRQRQYFASPPSGQHKIDKINSYRVVAKAQDATLLPLLKRKLALGRGPGWSGQASWWYVADSQNHEIPGFLARVRTAMKDLRPSEEPDVDQDEAQGQNAPATEQYRRYVQAYELIITPRHRDLQESFSKYISKNNAKNIVNDKNYVDLRYSDTNGDQILCEIKPCSEENARFAIRCAIGQLIDYRQSENRESKLLIVLGAKPAAEKDVSLALDNGFGIAWALDGGSFYVRWAEQQLSSI